MIINYVTAGRVRNYNVICSFPILITNSNLLSFFVLICRAQKVSIIEVMFFYIADLLFADINQFRASSRTMRLHSHLPTL